MDTPTTSRRRWPRVTIVLPPEQAERLAVIARTNYRTGRAEALRLLLDGIEREARHGAGFV